MILENMTARLVVEEFNAGKQWLLGKVEAIAKKARKKLGNAKGKWVRKDFTDPQKNLWRVLLYATRKRYHILPYLEYNDNRGKMRVVLQTSGGECIQIFTGHFFRRFRERADFENLTGNVIDDIFLFLTANSRHAPTLSQANIVQVEFPTGLGLGYSYGESVYLIKTFITHDMMRADQAEISERIQEELGEAC